MKQDALWVELILAFTRFFSLCEVNVDEIASSSPLFHNERLQRMCHVVSLSELACISSSKAVKLYSRIVHVVHRLNIFLSLSLSLLLATGRLSPDEVRELFDVLVEREVAEWVDTKSKTRLLIYWRQPSEWASLLYQWVCVVCGCWCVGG
jgi:ESCRT-II complex subunit